MTRSFWGWGDERAIDADERAIDADEREGVKLLLGVASFHELPAPALAAIAPAVTARGRPASLAPISSDAVSRPCAPPRLASTRREQ